MYIGTRKYINTLLFNYAGQFCGLLEVPLKRHIIYNIIYICVCTVGECIR